MELFEKLNVPFDAKLTSYYNEGLELYTKLGNFIFDKERITRLHLKYNVFPCHLDVILKAADAVWENKNLAKYCYIIISLIKNNVELPNLKMPDTNTIDTDFAPFFSLFYFAEDMIAEYKKRELPEKIISDTFREYDTCISNYINIFARPGIRIYFEWLTQYTSLKIIRIGRFNIEIREFPEGVRVFKKGNDIKILMDKKLMHTKGGVFGSANMTDDEGKYLAEIKEENGALIGYCPNNKGYCTPKPVVLEGYNEIIKKGDMVLSVHIPASEPLSPEIIEESLKEAWDIYKKYYPEFTFKCFVCFSWMINPHIAKIMGHETNVSYFASLFTKFPIESKGNGIYKFVYNLLEPVSPSALKDNTSLRKNIKRYLEEENIFYEYGGILFRN